MGRLLKSTMPWLVGLSLILVGCEQESGQSNVTPADKVLRNGEIYTLNPDMPWAEAVAIDDGVIVYVGEDAAASAYVGPDTQVVDLGGKMAMPGIIDAHVHAAWGGIKMLFQCNFPFSATPEEVAETIAGCVAEQPETQWIQGGQWDSNFFVDNDLGMSPAKWLDKVSGDKAIILRDDSGHNLWANSRAMELMGLTPETPNPPGVIYVRDPETGELTGVLQEAFSLISKHVPEWTPEQAEAGARYAVNEANRFGITGFKDASAEELETSAYYALDQQGDLTANVGTSLYAADENGKNLLDMALFERLRNDYKSPHVHTDFVKIFLDGVPTASRTAAMLEPYTPEEEGGEVTDGELHLEPDALAKTLQELDSRGFTVKIHTAGDRAVKVTLDAIASVREANGDSGLRHELAHAEFIAPEDIPRFSELNAVADFSPYIWFPSPIIDSIKQAIGERSEPMWPARDLLDADAEMLAGSDWPSAVPDMNPWTGLEALVTRQDPLGRYDGALWEDQAVSLKEALEIFTLGGAKALKLADKTGSLAVGKSADLIVLNHNLFEVGRQKISETTVNKTYFEGVLVYDQPGDK